MEFSGSRRLNNGAQMETRLLSRMFAFAKRALRKDETQYFDLTYQRSSVSGLFFVFSTILCSVRSTTFQHGINRTQRTH